MPSTFRSAYVYARVCGGLARAVLGEQAEALAHSQRVGEAWKTLFDENPPPLPSVALISAAEKKAISRALEEFRDLAGPVIQEPFFAALARKSEFSLVKSTLVALHEGLPTAPEPSDASADPGFNLAAYPDRDSMFRKSRYAWIVEEGAGDLTAAKNRLDRQYYIELWESLGTVARSKRGSLRELLRLDAELENVVWALRLRRYYAMKTEDIDLLLIKLSGVDIAGTALAALSLRSDLRSDWVGWKWERFINEAVTAGGGWYVDVRRVEASARRYLYGRFRRGLHLEPFTYAPLYCFFRIKEYETAAVLGVLEGLQLEAPVEEIAAFATELTGETA